MRKFTKYPGKSVTASTNYDTKIIAKYLKALFDDEAFGTSHTSSLNSFYRNNPNDPEIYMNRNGLHYKRSTNTVDLLGKTREEDIPIFKVIPQYSSTKRQGTYAPKLPKLVPIEEYNASHNIQSSTKITAAESYGWVVESWEAQDAYEFACEYFGEEELNKQIIQAMGSDELAENLAFIFRMNDFQEWYDREKKDDGEENEEDNESES